MSPIDAARLDGYIALFNAAESYGVDTTSLALAAAEGDDATSMIARVFLTAGAWLGDASPDQLGDVAPDDLPLHAAVTSIDETPSDSTDQVSAAIPG